MKVLPNPFYYLDNFHAVLAWISTRYSDLLLEWETQWIGDFLQLPQNARALLVRFIMRKGTLFRATKLSYQEIGCPHEAARSLVAHGWIENRPLLSADELFAMLTKAELAGLLPGEQGKLPGARKADLYPALQAQFPEPIPFDQLFPARGERLYRLADEVAAFSDRLRLMFFGNPHQDWTEFVLADLGIYQYEKVAIDAGSRAFQCRGDVDAYLHLHACRERFEQGEAPEQILCALGQAPTTAWLANRQAKFLYQIAYHLEQAGNLDKALALYRGCPHPDARLRIIRVLEKTGEPAAAYELVQAAVQHPANEEELQKLQRILPRLLRKLSLPQSGKSADKSIGKSAPAALEEWRLELPHPQSRHSVEEAVRRHLHQDATPVFYVENALINSLFGLLCWDAIFHPLPGAFFHPFHIGPADLHSPDFYQRRLAEFNGCLSQLETAEYRSTIFARFEEKAGIQSPFVFWGAISRELLALALDCIPAEHLRHWFLRILQDIKNNRSGFPDLIQLWPQEKRYRLVEVKGPGDRLQDNQVRLLAFAQQHGMPVAVCYVNWAEAAA